MIAIVASIFYLSSCLPSIYSLPTLTISISPSGSVVITNSSTNTDISPHEELYTTSSLRNVLNYIVSRINRSSIAPFMHKIMYIDPTEFNETDDPLEFCNDHINRLLNTSDATNTTNQCSPQYNCDYNQDRFPAFLVYATCQKKTYCGNQLLLDGLKHCNVYRESIHYLQYHRKGPYTQYHPNGLQVSDGVWFSTKKTLVTNCVCSK